MTGQSQTILDSLSTLNQCAGILAESVNLDPIFLEESWTLGVSAAVESQHRRRQRKADQEDQARTSRAVGNLGTASFLRAREDDWKGAAEAALADRAAAIVDRYDGISSHSWAPQDWIPEDQVAQRWMPQDWAPSYMPRFRKPQPAGQSTELDDCTMTAQRARVLLEVAPSSTHDQIRSAYRRMVGQWHPDRLQFSSETVRIHATRHMVELNEAYRLLRAVELEQAA